MQFLKKASLVCSVFALVNLGAIEFFFEETHQATIIQCEGSVEAPSLINDRWQEKRVLAFDNGLGGYITSLWDEETSAHKSVGNTYTGPVNLIHGIGNCFYLIHPDTNYATQLESLWLDKSFQFENLKKITSITVNTERKNWYSYDMKIVVIIELDDGTCWKPLSPDSWMEWKTGERVLLIGNSQRQTFINIDKVLKKAAPVIKNVHLCDIEKL